MAGNDEDIMHYRVAALEKITERHEQSLAVLMRALWMMCGAIGFTQVILPLIDRLT